MAGFGNNSWQTTPTLDPKQEDSVLESVLNRGLGTLHYVGSSLDKAFGGRALRGLLGGHPEELKSLIPLSDTLGITDQRNRVSGEDLLKQAGILDGEGEKGTFELRDLAGPALEIATDPGTYLSLGTGSALTDLGKEAVKKGTLATTMAERIAQGQSGLAKFAGVPIGTGPAAEKIAQGLGWAGDKALYSYPGRVASQLFDPDVEGHLEAPVQKAMRGMQKDKAAREAAVRQKFADVGNYLEEHNLMDQGAVLRAHLEDAVAGPARPEMQPAIDMMLAINRGDLRAGQDLGRPIRELEGHFPRQMTPREDAVPAPMGASRRDFPVKSSNELARDPLFDIPGKTGAVNALASDDPLRQLLPTPLAAQQHVRRNYLGLTAADEADRANLAALQASGAALMPDQAQRLGQLNALYKQAEDLVDWHARLPANYVGKGDEFFGNSPLADQALAGLKHARADAAAGAAHDVLADLARPGQIGPDSAALPEALSAIGLTHDVIPMAGQQGAGAQATLLARLQAKGVLPKTAKIADLANLTVPRKAVEDLARHSRAFAMPEALQPFLSAWDSMTNLTKAFTTSWPATKTRNLLTGLWQNFVVGAHEGGNLLKPYLDANALRQGVLQDANLYPGLSHLSPDEASRALRERMFVSGLESGGGAESRQALGLGTHESPAVPQVPGSNLQPGLGAQVFNRDMLPDVMGGTGGNGMRVRGVGGSRESTLAPLAYMQKLDDTVDSLNRQSAFLALHKQGYTPQAAADLATAAHYDYGRMTGFEREVVRRLIPFYSWTRHNVPFQVSQLLSQPGGKVGSAIKAVDSLRDQVGFVPDYISDTTAVPVGKEEDGRQRFLTGMGLPFEDALGTAEPGSSSPVKDTVLQSLGMLNPLIKGPAELATGKQFFSGRDLKDLYSVTGNTALEQVLMNSPAARFVTAGRTLSDDRKSILDKALYLAGPGKVQDVDLDKARQISARELIEQSLQGNQAVKHFDRMYVKGEDLSKLSPQELQLYLLNNLLEKQRAEQAKGQKK